MESIIEKVYAVFGDELPVGSSEYSAVKAAPVSYLEIRKEFRTFAKFKQAYLAYAMQKRSTVEVVTKPAAPKPSAPKKDVTK